MGRPFFAPDAGVPLPLDPWILGWLYLPLAVKALHNGITTILLRCKHHVLKDASEGRKKKAALHLTKVMLYLSSVCLMWPVAGHVIADHLSTSPPMALSKPFEVFQHNVLYLKWTMTIPMALYLYELISDPHPSPVMWLHHGASLLGGGFFSGALPWLNLNDMLIFSVAAVIVWSFLTFNCVSYLSFATYQLLGEKHDLQKAYVIRVVSGFIVCVVGLEHTCLYVFMAFKIRYFESTAPIVAIFVLDSAIFFEHLWTLYCLRAMHASCMRRLAGKTKYPDADVTAQEGGFSRVVADRLTELDAEISMQVQSVGRRLQPGDRYRFSSTRRVTAPNSPSLKSASVRSVEGSWRSGLSTRLRAFHDYMKDLGADEATTAGMTRGEAMVLDQLLGDGQPLARHTCAALGLVRSRTDFADEGSMMSASSTPRSASVASAAGGARKNKFSPDAIASITED